MEMSEIIKQLRKERGLTQEELGNIIGVQKSAIRKYESGLVKNMKSNSIKRMADYFGVTPTYILGYEEKDETEEEKEYNTYIETLRTNRGMRILFDSAKNATPEELEKFVKIIEVLKDNK